MIKNILTWDLGATKCAVGLVEYHCETKQFSLKKRARIKMKNTHSLEDLIQQIENSLNYDMSEAHAICISAAGYYDGKFLLSNNSYQYSMPFANLAKKNNWPRFAVIHDYASIICATFTSYMSDPLNLTRLNQAVINPMGRRVAFGVGTGLGLKDGVMLPNGDFWLGQNEVGHMGIHSPPLNRTFHFKRHLEFIHFLQNKISEPITLEKILSGKGMFHLYQFFYPYSTEKTPEEMGEKIQSGQALEVLEFFAWYLGLFVGTVQLCFMPSGGLWITGGVILHYLDLFNQASFKEGILASPAYLEERKEYPLGVLSNPDHALIGSAYYAVKRLLS